MKRYRLLATAILAIAVAFVPSCQKYDELTQDYSELDQRVTNLEGRVTALETLCGKLNGNIGVLQSAVDVLQGRDYVTAVKELVEGGKVVGYEITFYNSGVRRIYNGKDGLDGKDGKDGVDGAPGQDGAAGPAGADGHTPAIGITSAPDGSYYWTLDGEPILGSDGNPFKAGGQNGLTPELKIDNGYWYVR